MYLYLKKQSGTIYREWFLCRDFLYHGIKTIEYFLCGTYIGRERRVVVFQVMFGVFVGGKFGFNYRGRKNEGSAKRKWFLHYGSIWFLFFFFNFDFIVLYILSPNFYWHSFDKFNNNNIIKFIKCYYVRMNIGPGRECNITNLFSFLYIIDTVFKFNLIYLNLFYTNWPNPFKDFYTII